MEEKNNLKVPTSEKATKSQIIVASNEYYRGVSNQMGTCPPRGIRANESWTSVVGIKSISGRCTTVTISTIPYQKVSFEAKIFCASMNHYDARLLLFPYGCSRPLQAFRRTTTLLGNIGLVRPTDASIAPIEYCKCS